MEKKSHPSSEPGLQNSLRSSQNTPFFVWVHQLNRLYQQASLRSGKSVALLGTDGPLHAESIRFVGAYGLAPEVCAGRLLEHTPVSLGHVNQRVQVNFIGLAGAMGILPYHYSTLISDRLRKKDRASADFLDIFFHRLMSFYYRAWIKYRLPYGHGVEKTSQTHSSTESWLRAVAGDSAPNTYGLQIYFSGYFQRQVRSAHGLAKIVTELVGVAAQVKELVGRWEDLPPQACTTLLSRRALRKFSAYRREGGSAAVSSLGAGVLLGRRWWHAGSGIDLVLGPLPMRTFNQWRKGTKGFEMLQQLVSRYVPFHLAVHVRFELSPEVKISTQLSERPLLGRNAWLTGPGHTLEKNGLSVRMALKTTLA